MRHCLLHIRLLGLSTNRNKQRKMLKEGNDMEWQPISTAPKDGTKILIHFQCEDFSDVDIYVAFYSRFFSSPWRIINDFGFNEHVPTHWMPLPDAPK